MRTAFDAVVVGSGPNGLAAAITLARAGKSVLVCEAADTVGGGLRSAELTLPGFVHDVCSSVQALFCVSPFFRQLPLAEHGLELLAPACAFGHPLDDGTAALAYQDIDQTADTLGVDAAAYRDWLQPLLPLTHALFSEFLQPIHLPKHFLALTRFASRIHAGADFLVNRQFAGAHARALFAGAAGHSVVPLEQLSASAFGMVMLLSAHTGGWPLVRRGSQQLANALVNYFRSLGGEITTGQRVRSLRELPTARAVLLDVSPRQVLELASDALPNDYAHSLRTFKHGPGVHKVDWALRGPIPWRTKALEGAGTVHVGGTFEEIASAEQMVWEGRLPEKPFVLLVQPTVIDPARAPAGRHTAWGYCHVPNGNTMDMTDRIESQVERFAPGFRDLILARHVMNTADLERRNPNLIGGDIGGGANTLRQVIARPVLRNPYSTRVPGLYLCSASTPPGGGVHGMCGYNAARTALREVFR